MKALLTSVVRQGRRQGVCALSTLLCRQPCHVVKPGTILGAIATTTRPLASTASCGSSSLSSFSKNNNNNPTVPRTNIALLGAVNAGKSVLMNVLTQSNVSIVHETAGTTTDPKICSMELHGTIGPVRLLDTPGINEIGELGLLKRQKALETVGQADVAVLVVDPFETTASAVESVATLLRTVYQRQEYNRQVVHPTSNVPSATTGNNASTLSTTPPQPLLIYNLRADKIQAHGQSDENFVSMLMEDFERRVLQQLPPNTAFPPVLAVDLQQTQQRDRVISFLEQHAVARPDSLSLLPDWIVQSDNSAATVFLNIPMDQQTPSQRLLRPQALVQEALLRNFVSCLAYRMDLSMARSEHATEVQNEKDRFLRVLDPLLTSGNLQLLVTDSQAMDIVAPWTLDSQGHEMVPITTFSITMIRYLSGGRLDFFVDGLRHLDAMMQGRATPKNENGKWRVLISEACNHTRLNLEKQCADIGTVQLPQHLHSVLGEQHVEIDFAFGKHAIFDPARYDLVLHCGGCMLTFQQMNSRVADLVAAGVPATNYGLLLSRMQSPWTLSRVLKPWGINYKWKTELHQLDDDKHDLVG